MKINTSLIKAKDNKEMSRLYAACKKCATIGCYKTRSEHWADDVVQELFMHVIDDFIDKYDNSLDIEPYLVTVAKTLSLGMVRKFEKELSSENYDPDWIPIGNIEASESMLDMSFERQADRIDEDRIRAKVRSLMNLNNGKKDLMITEDYNSEKESPREKYQRMHKRTLPTLTAVKIIKPVVVKYVPFVEVVVPMESKQPRVHIEKEKPFVVFNVTPEQKRLKEIRKLMRTTRKKFATALSITTHSLSAYEYGKTSDLPEGLLEEAEAILKNNLTRIKLHEKIEKLSMVEILDEWNKAYAVRVDNADLSNYNLIIDNMKISKSTLLRWINQVMRPDTDKIIKYSKLVERDTGIKMSFLK